MWMLEEAPGVQGRGSRRGQVRRGLSRKTPPRAAYTGTPF